METYNNNNNNVGDSNSIFLGNNWSTAAAFDVAIYLTDHWFGASYAYL